MHFLVQRQSVLWAYSCGPQLPLQGEFPGDFFISNLSTNAEMERGGGEDKSKHQCTLLITGEGAGEKNLENENP